MNENEIVGLIDIMPLKKKVGQLFVLAYPGKDIENISYLIKEYGIGGCYISQDNAETLSEAKTLTGKLQNISKIPILMAVDQEGAWGVLVPESTTGPGNLALGATGSYSITRDMYSVIGHEMATVGYNTILGPCADINLQPDNPIIDTRSFGESPIEVSKNVEAAIRGLSDVGSISTAKHFPGHGDTSADTHREIPVVDKDLKTLIKQDLYPFQIAINSGVDIIMTSHIKYPQIDKDNPATFSKIILKDILREKMEFSGLILSDSMNMGAIRRFYKPEDSAVLALQAGVELIMLSEEHYDNDENYLDKQIDTIEKVISYVEKGIIDEDLIDSILLKVLSFKHKKGLYTEYSNGHDLNYKKINRLSSEKSVGIIRDTNCIWPIKLNNIVVVNSIPTDLYKKVMNPRGIGPNQEKSAFSSFKERLEGCEHSILYYNYEEISTSDSLDSFDHIILVNEDYPLAGEDFWDSRVTSFINVMIEKYRSKIMVVGLRSPYDILNYNNLDFYLTSYSSRNSSAHAVADFFISGEVPTGSNILNLS